MTHGRYVFGRKARTPNTTHDPVPLNPEDPGAAMKPPFERLMENLMLAEEWREKLRDQQNAMCGLRATEHMPVCGCPFHAVCKFPGCPHTGLMQ